MTRNTELQAAKAKKDEFYTQLIDIEKELYHYHQHFRDKIVFCNCDNPFESNFFKYFVLNFNQLGLKELIATSYTVSNIVSQQSSFLDMSNISKIVRNNSKSYVARVTIVHNIIGNNDINDIAYLFKDEENSLKELEGDGDFRSQECIELLKQSDIVVTNPPFSLFREYVTQLEKYKKKFIIIGNVNAITYKEFFSLLMNNKVWIGSTIHSGDRKFNVPDDYPLNAAGCGIDENGKKFIKVKGVRWFTNLDFKQRHEKMILVKEYSEEKYPNYDNYNAIEVSITANIPKDYSGIMGVPITFLDKYNPDQFEIIGSDYNVKEGFLDYIINKAWKGKLDRAYLNGKRCYSRLLIRNKHPKSVSEVS